MSALIAHKVVAALPDPLEPDALYAVRVGDGFDLYIADATGSLAFKVNTGPKITVSDTAPTSPSVGDLWVDTSA